MRGKREPDCNINLGLAIFETQEWQAKRKRWCRRLKLQAQPTFDEIAALSGCKRSAIQLIVIRALRKCRIRLIEHLSEQEIRDSLKALVRAHERREFDYHRS